MTLTVFSHIYGTQNKWRAQFYPNTPIIKTMPQEKKVANTKLKDWNIISTTWRAEIDKNFVSTRPW